MSNVLMLGIGPLPAQECKRLYAPGLRTWSFAWNIACAGHRVTCATTDFGGIEEEAPLPEPMDAAGPHHTGTLAFERLHFDVTQNIKALRKLHDRLGFHCAVSTTDLMNRSLAQAHLPIPVWLDFNGPPMIERQMQAAVYDSDDAVQKAWNEMLPSLMFGDRFSSCSLAQKQLMVGELGAAGRLNRRTAYLDIVQDIPPVNIERDFTPSSKKVIRGRLCGERDFVLLWTGGYNTWTDVDTLLGGLELAMRKHPHFHYVSTGGKIEGHDELTFQRFMERIDHFEFRDRCHFVGWVQNSEIPDYYAESDAAINLDAPSYEAMFGYRNRVQEWALAGLPVISTALSEITRKMEEEGLLTEIEPRDPESLANAITRHIVDPGGAQARALTAKAWIEEELAPERLLTPLLEWCGKPEPTPDLPPPHERPKARWAGPDNNLAMSYVKHFKKYKLL
ncbi:glycosyltransferase family 4 protein [Candidatus Sumerlaeota bacterium]|nr:glycosyltransferase family 4 protein [Candidatus Sumerlaeota bacterium]